TKVGIPFARASVQTPAGIFFLNNDYMVYRLQGGQLEPIGKQIQRELRTNLKDFTTAFMGWHATAQQVTLYYTETSGNSPERGFTFNTENSTWTPQAFGNAVTAGFEARVANSLVETLVASDGTALSYSTSAISDGWVSAGELVRSEAVFGGFYTDSPNREVFNDEIRLTYTANSGSYKTSSPPQLLHRSASTLNSRGSTAPCGSEARTVAPGRSTTSTPVLGCKVRASSG
ncbi:hypothetical protein LCGC14_1751440, partial [marine sediment metagenome]